MCLCDYMSHVCWHSWKPEKGIRSPGPGSWELESPGKAGSVLLTVDLFLQPIHFCFLR